MDRNNIINDPETAQRYSLDGRQAQIWTAMPAIVISVDLAKMTCAVQPSIKGIQTSEDGTETFVNLPKLVDVPICFPSAGGFTLSFPIASADEVLVVIANRCIDSWWELGGAGPLKLDPQIPSEFRMHDLSDGFAIPGPRSQPRVVPNISTTNVQLRNDAGTCYLEITPGGQINLVAPGGVAVTGGLTFTGNLHVTGNLSADGEVIAKAATLPKLLSTHVHSGVTTGGGNSGPPV